MRTCRLWQARGIERQVIRIRDVSPDIQIVDISQVGRDWDSRRTMWGAGHPKDRVGERMQRSVCILASATEVRAKDDTQGLAAADPSPVVRMVAIPEVGRVETIQLSSPPRSDQLSPDSPRTIAFEDLGDSSVPLSPNRIQAGRSQEVPEDGSLFSLSPVSPRFLMCPSGAAGQHPEAGLPLPSALESFSDCLCSMCADSGVGYPFDIACLYDACLVFCSDSFGVVGLSSAGGVVLRYGPDCGHC